MKPSKPKSVLSYYFPTELSKWDKQLIKAAKEGDVEAARNALKNGANINSRDVYNNYNYTPLILAAKYGHDDIIVLLLTYPQLDIHAATGTNNNRNTALHWAARNGHDICVTLLLAHPESKKLLLKEENEFGNIPLHWAAENNHFQVIEILCQCNPQQQLETSNKNSSTPIHLSVKKENELASCVLLRFLQNPKPLHMKDLSGYTPLHHAAINGNMFISYKLMHADHEKKFNIKSSYEKRTACQLAYKKGHNELVHSMLNLLPDSSDASDAVKDMLEYIKNRSEYSSASRSVSGMLFNYCSEQDHLLLTSARDGDLPGVKNALANGANINARDVGIQHGNCTALIHACKGNYLNIVEYLLTTKTKYDIDTKAQTYYGNTALHWAALNNNKKIVKAIIKSSPESLSIQEFTNGYTPLHYACEKGLSEIVTELIKANHGKHANIRAKDGYTTPFRLAVNANHMETAYALIENYLNDSKPLETLGEYIGYLYFKNLIMNTELPAQVKQTILRNWEKATANEIILMLDMLILHANQDYEFAEFIQGGHFVINDNGLFYNKWKTFSPQTNRDGKSSHKSCDNQFSIQGVFVRECLFGTCEIDGKKHSWLQLESHSTSIWQLGGHMISYIEYRKTGMNISRYGRSQYTDTNPYRLALPTHSLKPTNENKQLKPWLDKYFSLTIGKQLSSNDEDIACCSNHGMNG